MGGPPEPHALATQDHEASRMRAPRHAVTFNRATPPVRARSGSVGPHSETQVQAWSVLTLTSQEPSSARETASQGLSVSSLLPMTGCTSGCGRDRELYASSRRQWSRPLNVPGCAPAPFTNHQHIILNHSVIVTICLGKPYRSPCSAPDRRTSFAY